MEQIKRVIKQKPRPLRYNILLQLQAYPSDIRAKIKDRMRKACNDCSRSTLHRWLNSRHGDSIDIPASHIVKIAEILNCRMEALFNDDNDC